MFRPSLETLEKREVFSAGPLVAFQVGGTEARPTESMSLNVMPRGETQAAVVSGNAGNDALRVAAGDFNGDGRPDLALMADGSVRYLRQLLPYIEQDNLYKSSVGGIDIIVDDVFYLNGLYRDLHAQEASDNANDIIFARLGEHGDSLSVNDDPPHILVGMLLPVIHRPGQGGNTNASVTDLVIDPFNQNVINWGDGHGTQARSVDRGSSSPTVLQASIMGSPEYFQALGQATPDHHLIGTLGRIWKTTS